MGAARGRTTSRSPTTPSRAPGCGRGATTAPATAPTWQPRWPSGRAGPRCTSPATALEPPRRTITPPSPTTPPPGPSCGRGATVPWAAPARPARSPSAPPQAPCSSPGTAPASPRARTTSRSPTGAEPATGHPVSRQEALSGQEHAESGGAAAGQGRRPLAGGLAVARLAHPARSLQRHTCSSAPVTATSMVSISQAWRSRWSARGPWQNPVVRGAGRPNWGGAGAFAAAATRALARDIAAFTGRQDELGELTSPIDGVAAGGGVVGIHAISGTTGKTPSRCTPRAGWRRAVLFLAARRHHRAAAGRPGGRAGQLAAGGRVVRISIWQQGYRPYRMSPQALLLQEYLSGRPAGSSGPG